MSKLFKCLLPSLMSLLMLAALLTGLFGQLTNVQADNHVSSDTVRFATFNASLNRGSEGQLITDLRQLTNTQISAVAEIIQRVNPDVLLINEFDYNVADPHKAPQLFRDNYLAKGQNGAAPVSYPYHYVASVNTGVPSGMDFNNDGKVGGPNDAYGFGFFPGQYGMVIYSKYPILTDSVRTFQKFLWKDMPGALLPATVTGSQTISWYSQAELDVFRLSSKSHWDVPIKIGDEVVHALVSHPTPPVFDGPEDRNGTRNHDEIRLWADYVTPNKSGYIYDDKGVKGGLTQAAKFVIMGDQNADPFDGDSTNNAIKQLLDNPNINTSNPPASEGAVEQAKLQGGINISHTGNSAYDTGDFRDDTQPGNLRVDYVLPSLNMSIKSSGVFWPKKDDPLFRLVGTYPFPSSDHRLVYVTLDIATNQISIPAIQGNDKDSPLVGKTVNTKGIVTAVFPKGQVFIQDGYGPRTGIMAFRPKTTATLKVGDYITLMGKVEERYGLTQLAFGAQAQVISSGNTLPAPKVLTSGAVSSENWESVLVRVENVRVSNENPDAPSNYGEWEIDDGSGAVRVDDLVKVAYKQTRDDSLDFVQGPLYYSFNNFKIVPRYNADIGYVGLTKSSLGSVAAGQSYTYTLTINNQSDKSLTHVVITDTLPSGVSFAAASHGGARAGNMVRWTGLTVTTNSSLSVTFVVTATGQNGTIIENKDYAFKADNYNRVVQGEKVSTVIGQVTIPLVQGKGKVSPLEGQNVTVSGAVVGTFQGDKALRGFFIQDPNGDGDPMTSDGIFVYAPTYTTPLTVGQMVVVTGKVQEERAMTRIMATNVDPSTALSPVTIKPMTVNLPFSSTTVPEQYEGMLVKLPQTLYVTELYNLGRYGEMLLSANARLMQPTDVVTPGQASIDRQAANRLNQIRVDDGRVVSYPDPIVYPAPGLSYSRTVRGGDTVAGLTGIMDDNFGRYRVQPVSSVIVTPVNSRPAKPQDVGGSLKVAAFNVLNYFTSLGDAGRGASNADEFARQRAKIVSAIITIDAAVVGLIEIENNGYGSDSAIQNLVNGLNEATGKTTYAFIKPTAAKIGQDQIAVGFIYQPDMVTPVGAAAILDDAAFTNPNNLDQPKNRPALAQTFKDKNGGMVTAVVNHFKSKGSKCGAGDDDTTTGQGSCNNTRTKAAQALAKWLATDPTNSGDPDYLILGDLNSYAMEDPIRALESAGYTNLAKKFGANYSYVFSGQWGFLDYAMSNAKLTPQVTGATVWHVNADEPRVLDYNTENKSAAQKSSLYGPGPYRSSDHDPLVVGLNLDSPMSSKPGKPTVFEANLSGKNELPPVTSNASGRAVFSLITTTNAATLYYRVMVSDIVSVTMAHIHKGAAGTNGPPIFWLYDPSGKNGPSDPLGPNMPIQGALSLTPTQLATLLAGNYYVNVHTAANPNGEVRGQITPFTPESNYVAILNGANERPPVNTEATGTARFTLGDDLTTFTYGITVSDIMSITAAHIHVAAADKNGPVVHGLFNASGQTAPVSGLLAPGSPVSGTVMLTAKDLVDLLTDYLYVNVHTSKFSTGEIRGPIKATRSLGKAAVKVAHFAPLTRDSGPRQGTLVDVRVNGTIVQQGIRFNNLTPYLSLTEGNLFVEILQGGAPVISKTIAATAGMSYTIVAMGGNNGYPLSLLTLVDNTADPMSGTGKVRIVHVAPFTSSNKATVDVINQADNSQVVSGLPYGAASPSITAYHTLPAASYDLAVVAPGTTNVLIDLAPFSLNDGQIVTIFAIGDGDNQPLGTVREILKLGTPIKLKTLLPILLKP